ncbi:hypothetical protein Bca4012_025580 [Brassica carinata]
MAIQELITSLDISSSSIHHKNSFPSFHFSCMFFIFSFDQVLLFCLHLLSYLLIYDSQTRGILSFVRTSMYSRTKNKISARLRRKRNEVEKIHNRRFTSRRSYLVVDPELLSTWNLANLRVKAELGCCLDHLSYPIVSTAADEEGDMLSHVEVRV